MSGGFPFAHRTVEEVVRDGDMHWPLLAMSLGVPTTIGATLRETFRAQPPAALKFIPVHGSGNL